MKLLTTPRMERCIGCHSCSLACARLIHKRISWSTSGIRIHSTGGLSTGFTAVRCLACDPAPCAEACPTGALTQRQGGGVIVRAKHCIKCGDCVTACPVEAIYQDNKGISLSAFIAGSVLIFVLIIASNFRIPKRSVRYFYNEGLLQNSLR